MMEVDATTPDEWLAELGDDTMVELDLLVVESMPDRSRTLRTGTFWGGTDQTIIGYGDLVQQRPSGTSVEWFLVGPARQSRHYSIYVNAVADGAYLAKRYADRLGRVELGAASIGFTSLERIDLDVVAELLRHADRITSP